MAGAATGLLCVGGVGVRLGGFEVEGSGFYLLGEDCAGGGRGMGAGEEGDSNSTVAFGRVGIGRRLLGARRLGRHIVPMWMWNWSCDVCDDAEA